jgi:hypothetical protein
MAVARSLFVWVKVFIPGDAGFLLLTGPFRGSTVVYGPVDACFLTDQRGFDSDAGASARVHAFLFVNLSTGRWHDHKWAGRTTQVDCRNGREERHDTAVVKGSGFSLASSTSTAAGSVSEFGLEASASDPLYWGLAPKVQIEGSLKVTVAPSGSEVTLDFTGLIEPWPSFEMYASVNGGSPGEVFKPRPPVPGSGPFDLFGDPDQPVSGRLELAAA